MDPKMHHFKLHTWVTLMYSNIARASVLYSREATCVWMKKTIGTGASNTEFSDLGLVTLLPLHLTFTA